MSIEIFSFGALDITPTPYPSPQGGGEKKKCDCVSRRFYSIPTQQGGVEYDLENGIADLAIPSPLERLSSGPKGKNAECIFNCESQGGGYQDSSTLSC